MTDTPNRKTTPKPFGKFVDPGAHQPPVFPEHAARRAQASEDGDVTIDRTVNPTEDAAAMMHGPVTTEMLFAELREHRKILEAHGRKIEAVHDHTRAIAQLTENVNNLWTSALHSRSAQDKTGKAMKEFRKAMTAASKAFELADDDEHAANGGSEP